MNTIKKIFDYKGVPILTSLFLSLFLIETRWALRKRTQKRRERVITNTLVSIPGVSLMRFFVLPVMYAMAVRNKSTRIGLAYRISSNSIVKETIAFLIMDYSNYLWHYLNHKLPFLWRFHLVHHTDLDLDVTTALRFHFGEMIGSVFYRSVFVYISGASPMNVLIYEIVFEASTAFHHSNTRLPFAIERKINTCFVTPRMHGIHHSVNKDETDSNYSVIFSWWDRLHKTLCFNVPDDTITIGVPSYQNANELSATYLTKMPFYKVRAFNNQY